MYRVCEKCKVCVWGNHKHCPKCDSAPEKHRMENYDSMWHEADIYCNICNEFVRYWDAG